MYMRLACANKCLAGGEVVTCTNLLLMENTMKAKTPVASATPSVTQVTFLSIDNLKNAGYQSALAVEHLSLVAKYVFDQCPNILEDVPAEVKAQLTEGWALRWQELNPAKRYNSEWIPDAKGGNEVTLAYALSFSQQQFGQLRQSEPVKHGVIGGVRTPFNKYAFNKMKALLKAIRDLNPETRERGTTDDFATYVGKVMDTIKTRCKNAKARGDATADEVKTRVAIDAFLKAIK